MNQVASQTEIGKIFSKQSPCSASRLSRPADTLSGALSHGQDRDPNRRIELARRLAFLLTVAERHRRKSAPKRHDVDRASVAPEVERRSEDSRVHCVEQVVGLQLAKPVEPAVAPAQHARASGGKSMKPEGDIADHHRASTARGSKRSGRPVDAAERRNADVLHPDPRSRGQGACILLAEMLVF